MFAATIQQLDEEWRRRRRKSWLSELGERLAYRLWSAGVRSLEKE
jgi:hypothetical protein